VPQVLIREIKEEYVHRMTRFLNVIAVSAAVEVARKIAPPPQPETVPLDLASGRILAAPVRSDTDIPGFDRSVVDGYAVRAADTVGSSEAMPAMLRCVGRVAMGEVTVALRAGPGECAYVPTGGILPDSADAVVMVENAEPAGDMILVKKVVSFGENVLRHDEDYRKGDVVLPAGRRLSPQDTGVLAAAGCGSVPVTRKPVVGIISTGNELVPLTKVPKKGQVRDANASMLAAYLQGYGCLPRQYGIVRDEKAAFESAIAKAVAECDVVLLSGGSSKDDRDLTAGTIAAKGEVLVHGIAIAPGKPTIIGRVFGKPVFGLPGHPASAYIVLIAIVCPLLDRMIGADRPQVRTVTATLDLNVPSQRGREDYVRVKVNDGIATPVFGKSGLLNTLVASDGVIRIPAGSEGLEKGSTVEVILW